MAVPIFEANNYGYDILWVFPHEHAQCATWVNYRISSCNFIADWTIVMGKIYIGGFTLA